RARQRRTEARGGGHFLPEQGPGYKQTHHKPAGRGAGCQKKHIAGGLLLQREDQTTDRGYVVVGRNLRARRPCWTTPSWTPACRPGRRGRGLPQHLPRRVPHRWERACIDQARGSRLRDRRWRKAVAGHGWLGRRQALKRALAATLGGRSEGALDGRALRRLAW